MQLDDLMRCAEADLILVDPSGQEDCYLWEYSRRVDRNARTIASLKSLRTLDVNLEGVSAAAWYHAAGWALRVRNGATDRHHVLLSPLDENLLEDAASLLTERLDGILSAESVRLAAQAVRVLLEREPEILEAKIVAEARALEEFGLLSLWPALRKGMLDGKGVQALLETWRRKHEYHFWPARLKDAFRFDEVREIARRRLAVLESFIAALTSEHDAEDLREAASAKEMEAHSGRPH